MRINQRLLGIFFGLLGVIVFGATIGFPNYPGSTFAGPAMFPRVVALGFIACAAALFLHVDRNAPGAPPLALDPEFSQRRNVVNFLAVPAAVIIYLAAVDYFGFVLVVALLLGGLILLFDRHPWRAAIYAIALTLAIHTLFYKLLSVPLPWGLLAPVAW